MLGSDPACSGRDLCHNGSRGNRPGKEEKETLMRDFFQFSESFLPEASFFFLFGKGCEWGHKRVNVTGTQGTTGHPIASPASQLVLLRATGVPYPSWTLEGALLPGSSWAWKALLGTEEAGSGFLGQRILCWGRAFTQVGQKFCLYAIRYCWPGVVLSESLLPGSTIPGLDSLL